MTASSKILSSTSRRLSLLNRRLLPLIALAALSIAAQAEPTVPFHGSATFSGEQTVIEPGIWLLTGSGSGVASQVGKLKVEFVYLIDVQQGTVTGSATATAANGDTFSGTVQGNWSQTGITGIVVIVGGTGRFTGATGSAVFETSADTVVYDGTITYARSHRK